MKLKDIHFPTPIARARVLLKIGHSHFRYSKELCEAHRISANKYQQLREQVLGMTINQIMQTHDEVLIDIARLFLRAPDQR